MQNAGASDKSAALEEMRAAKNASDEQGGELNKNATVGKVEQTLGNVTGCEGMEEEGVKRQSWIELMSGTCISVDLMIWYVMGQVVWYMKHEDG